MAENASDQELTIYKPQRAFFFEKLSFLAFAVLLSLVLWLLAVGLHFVHAKSSAYAAIVALSVTLLMALATIAIGIVWDLRNANSPIILKEGRIELRRAGVFKFLGVHTEDIMLDRISKIDSYPEGFFANLLKLRTMKITSAGDFPEVCVRGLLASDLEQIKSRAGKVSAAAAAAANSAS